MRHPWRFGALALALSVAAPAAMAADLVEVWQAAARNDRTLAVAGAAHAAAQPRRAMAEALWRPNVALSASLGIAGSDTSTQGAQFSAPGFGQSGGVAFATSVNSGTAARAALTAVQPLYNPQRRAQQQQLGLSVDLADLQWQAARQALMLRTAERYFDLALAEEALRVQQRQLESVQRAGDEAQDRFKLGSVPVTDTYEAQARLGGVRAQRLAADSELRLKRQWLADSTGLPAETLQARLPLGQLAGLPTGPLDSWLAEAEAGNPGIRQRRLALEVARQEAAKHSRRASATVDLVAQLSREHLGGHGDFGSASNAAGNRSIGVQLNLPLFTGGYRDARQQEALKQADQAEAEVDDTRLQVAQQVRSAWLGLSVGSERMVALAQALLAAEARRDATELGRQVGHRTTLDLLNAENDRAAARLALAQARVAVLMARLQLSALTGRLDEETLRLAGQALAPAAAP
jgi:outer membrane protein